MTVVSHNIWATWINPRISWASVRYGDGIPGWQLHCR